MNNSVMYLNQPGLITDLVWEFDFLIGKQVKLQLDHEPECFSIEMQTHNGQIGTLVEGYHSVTGSGYLYDVKFEDGITVACNTKWLTLTSCVKIADIDAIRATKNIPPLSNYPITFIEEVPHE